MSAFRAIIQALRGTVNEKKEEVKNQEVSLSEWQANLEAMSAASRADYRKDTVVPMDK